MSTELMTAVNKHADEIAQKQLKSFLKLLVNHGTHENPLKSLIQAGNLKIPKQTAIFNMSSATDCASLALGICKACVYSEELQALKTVCYALKSERDYRPNVLPYRRRQQDYWLEVTAEEFVIQFLMINAMKPKPFDKVRFNEAGDFHSQDCIVKANKIAKLLKPYGIVCYCYTSRDDLNYERAHHLVINGSGFKKKGIQNEFRMIERLEDRPKGYAICPMDCTKCDRCSKKGKDTVVLKH